MIVLWLIQVPIEEDQATIRTITWVDKQHYRAIKVEYMNRKTVC